MVAERYSGENVGEVMRRPLIVLSIGTFAVMTACIFSQSPFGDGASDYQYEVLNPCAEVGRLPRIVYKGSYEEANSFFYRRGWTDGLPIVPPTEEAVAEIMTGTDLHSP